MSRSRKILKWFGIGVGVLFGLLLIAMITIPFIIDVDDYRPQIVKKVNENMKMALASLAEEKGYNKKRVHIIQDGDKISVS